MLWEWLDMGKFGHVQQMAGDGSAWRRRHCTVQDSRYADTEYILDICLRCCARAFCTLSCASYPCKNSPDGRALFSQNCRGLTTWCQQTPPQVGIEILRPHGCILQATLSWLAAVFCGSTLKAWWGVARGYNGLKWGQGLARQEREAPEQSGRCSPSPYIVYTASTGEQRSMSLFKT